MYTKKRPVIVNCGLFPNGGYIALNTKAETIDELKQDINSKAQLTLSQLDRYQFTVCNEVMQGGTIPLFEKGSGILSVDQPEFDEAVSNFRTDLNDPVRGAKYLYITMSEKSKYVENGADQITTIAQASAYIENNGLLYEFTSVYGCSPEESNLSTLLYFITRKNSERNAVKPKSETERLIQAIEKLTKSNEILIKKLAEKAEEEDDDNDDYDEDDDDYDNDYDNDSDLLDVTVRR